MSDIKAFFDGIMRFYDVEITLYGYTFTFFDLFIFGSIMSMLAYLIKRIFF